MVLLVLSLCVIVSYCGVSAILIDWLAILLKGLFGYGYWLAGPALLLAAVILLFHHGRPVQLRDNLRAADSGAVWALWHIAFCKGMYESGIGILQLGYGKDGVALAGGAVSGCLAEGSVAVFSPVVSIILFTALLVILVMVALRLTVGRAD